MKQVVIAAALLAFGAAATSAVAQDKPTAVSGDTAAAPAAKKAGADQKRADWEAKFKKADADGSGGLSKAELEKTSAKQFSAIKKKFDAMDANKDGQITLAERYAHAEAAKKAKAGSTAAK